jgi:hypothetical protein
MMMMMVVVVMMRMMRMMRTMRTKTPTKTRTTTTTTADTTPMFYSITCSIVAIRVFAVPPKDRESQIEGLEPKGDSPQKLDAGIIEFKERLSGCVDLGNFTKHFLGISWLYFAIFCKDIYPQ